MADKQVIGCGRQLTEGDALDLRGLARHAHRQPAGYRGIIETNSKRSRIVIGIYHRQHIVRVGYIVHHTARSDIGKLQHLTTSGFYFRLQIAPGTSGHIGLARVAYLQVRHRQVALLSAIIHHQHPHYHIAGSIQITPVQVFGYL